MGKLEERKTQKIGDSNNNDRTGAWKCSIKKVFLEYFVISQENACARVSFLIKFQACSDTGIIFLSILQKFQELFFLVNASSCYFLQMSPNLKWRRTEHTQFKNKLKAKQHFETILIIFKEEKMIHGRKNVNVVCKDLVSWVARK